MRVLLSLTIVACSSSAPIEALDASGADATAEASATNDANANDGSTLDANEVNDANDASDGCFVTTVGVFGTCIDTSACASLGDHVSTPGYCPGPANIECCTQAPNVADNPPVPAGWTLMQQADVTQAMTNWAVAILNDPVTYPMFSTTTQMFGTLDVLARVEWHPPDFQNGAIHRGVTLYDQ